MDTRRSSRNYGESILSEDMEDGFRDYYYLSLVNCEKKILASMVKFFVKK